MTRKKIVAGNWKMNTSITEGIELARDICAAPPIGNVTLIIAPPLTHLYAIKRVVTGTPVLLAAQNCHDKMQGAYTGEISASMLKSIGVDSVIIGHSERREYFHEDHDFLKAKIEAALAHDLGVIFCCGEPLSIRQEGKAKSFVEKQLKESLFHLDPEQMARIVIAYEPIWAIGTGVTASPDQAQEMHAFIRDLVAGQYNKTVSDQVPVLYGGSVKPSNAKELFSRDDVDGGLVGGASLDAEGFIQIAKSY